MNYSIRDLSPVVTDASIIGLVTRKSSIHTFTGKDGNEKQVFSFTIQDGKDSIRCTCWGKLVIHADGLNIDDVVQIEYPDVKTKTISKYGSETTSDYELHLTDKNENANIHLVVQRRDRTPILFRPLDPIIMPIRSLSSLKGQTVNICAGVGKVSQPDTIKRKNGGTTMKCKLFLFDQTGELPLILWGEEMLSMINKLIEGKTVIYVSAVQLSEFKGEMQASTSTSSEIILDSTLPYSQDLANWMRSPDHSRKIQEYFHNRADQSVGVKAIDISKKYQIGELINLQVSNNNEYFGYFQGILSRITILEDCFYSGCASCKRKIVDSAFSCQCEEQLPSWFYIVEADFMDQTAKINGLKLFDATEKMLKVPANEFHEFPSQKKLDCYHSILWKRFKICFKNFKMNMGKNGKATYSVLSCEPSDGISTEDGTKGYSFFQFDMSVNTNIQAKFKPIFDFLGIKPTENFYADVRSIVDVDFSSKKMNNRICYALFQAYDTNGDGSIDATELGQLLKDIGNATGLEVLANAGEEQVKEVLQSLDTDQNGSIEWPEFNTFIQNL